MIGNCLNWLDKCDDYFFFLIINVIEMLFMVFWVCWKYVFLKNCNIKIGKVVLVFKCKISDYLVKLY